MKRMTAAIVPLLSCLPLFADMCLWEGVFDVEAESADPQVAMVIHDVIYHMGGDCDRVDKPASQVLSVSYFSNGGIKEARILSSGIGLTNGLNDEGTVCTAPGIYRFGLTTSLYEAPGGYFTYNEGYNCIYSFVLHDQSCPEQGTAIDTGSEQYQMYSNQLDCGNTLEDAMGLANAAGYDDPPGPEDDTVIDDEAPVADEDVPADTDSDTAPVDTDSAMNTDDATTNADTGVPVADENIPAVDEDVAVTDNGTDLTFPDNDSKKGGCALMLID